MAQWQEILAFVAGLVSQRRLCLPSRLRISANLKCIQGFSFDVCLAERLLGEWEWEQRLCLYSSHCECWKMYSRLSVRLMRVSVSLSVCWRREENHMILRSGLGLRSPDRQMNTQRQAGRQTDMKIYATRERCRQMEGLTHGPLGLGTVKEIQRDKHTDWLTDRKMK